MGRISGRAAGGGERAACDDKPERRDIGAKTFEKFGRPEQVLLSFERRYDLIAIEPVTVHATNAFPLVEKKNGGHRVIRANLFCRHHGINFAGTIAFNTPEISEKGVIVLNLREIRGVSKPRRLRQKHDR